MNGLSLTVFVTLKETIELEPEGCIDPTANNFDPLATKDTDPSSCTYDPIPSDPSDDDPETPTSNPGSETIDANHVSGVTCRKSSLCNGMRIYVKEWTSESPVNPRVASMR